MTGDNAATEHRQPVRRALISVSDKTGLLDLAASLHAAGVALVSTGSTARTIADSGVPVTPVEEVTGFAEALDGRVKTLHPSIHVDHGGGPQRVTPGAGDGHDHPATVVRVGSALDQAGLLHPPDPPRQAGLAQDDPAQQILQPKLAATE